MNHKALKNLPAATVSGARGKARAATRFALGACAVLFVLGGVAMGQTSNNLDIARSQRASNRSVINNASSITVWDGATYTYEGFGVLATTSGGALYVNGASASLTIGPKDDGTGLTVFKRNQGRVGGAIAVQNGAKLYLTNVRFGDIADVNAGNMARSESGGAIYSQGTVVSILNSEFYRNMSVRDGSGGFGGAIHVNASGTLTVRDSAFGNIMAPGQWDISNPSWDPFAAGADRGAGNWAVSGNGGAINFQHAASVGQIYNSKFYYNTATRNAIASGGAGGAISLSVAGASVSVEDSVFYGNRTRTVSTPALGGGAIFLAGASITIKDSIFENNMTTSYGGAINSQGTVNFIVTKDMTWKGNLAVSSTTSSVVVPTKGGFMFMYSNSNPITNFNIDGGATLIIGGTANVNHDTIASDGIKSIINVNPGAGSGTLVLHANSNAFSGTMNIHAGRVLLGNINARFTGTNIISVKSGAMFGGGGLASNVFVESGGVLQVGIEGGPSSLLGVSGTLRMSGGSKIMGNGGIASMINADGNPTNTIVVGMNAGDWVTAEVLGGSVISISGGGTLTGVGGLIKTGDGDLHISRGGNYTGGTRLEGGRIIMNAPTSIGTSLLSITGSATSLILNGTMTVANDINIGGGVNIMTVAGSTVLSGNITGAGMLEKSSGGALSLNNASTFTGTVSIREGSLSGNINASSSVLLHNTAYDGSLIRLSGQSLAGSGTITGALAINGGKLSFDLRNSDGMSAYDNLSVGSAASSVAGSVVNLANIGTSSTYTLIRAANISGVDTAHFSFTVDGHAQTNRTDARLDKDTTLNTLSVAAGVRNLRMTWAGGATGAPGVWDAHAANWNESSGEKWFRQGDSVVFGAATSGTISIVSTGMTVGDMSVDATTGQTYTFTGGGITGTNALTDSDGHAAGADGKVYLGGSSSAVTSKLVKDGAGALVFANAANTFAGGVELRSGTLAFRDGDQLGGPGIDITNNATLRVDASTNLGGRMSVSAGKTATIDTRENLLDFTGTITSAADSKITKTGSGELWIYNANHSGNLGATDVKQGALYLAGNSNLGAGAVTVSSSAAFGGYGSAQSVTLLANSALQVGTPAASAAERLSIGSALTLNTGATLHFNIISGNANPAASVNSTLTAGSVTFASGAAGGITLDLDRLSNGYFNLGNASALTGAKITYSGMELGERQRVTYESTAASGTLLIKIDRAQNENMRWTGATDGNWNINTSNWQIVGSGSYTYDDGDKITFDGVADAAHAANRTINIAGRRMTLSDMVVSGTADYTFRGAAEIVTDKNSATPNIAGSAQGKLIKSGTGTLRFENAGNQFLGGIDVNGGAIAFTSADQLRTGGTGIFLDSGTLRAAAELIVLSEKIDIGANKSGAFDTAGHTARYTGTFAPTASGTFVKTGSGALEIISDNSAYAGSVLVNGGELLLRNDALSVTKLNGAVNVTDGGTFGGEGYALGAVTVGQGGALRIGTPVTGNEVLHVADLHMENGSQIYGGGTLDGRVTIGSAAGDLVTLTNITTKPVTITATTSGAGTLVKAGAGMLTLSGTAPLGHAQTRIEDGMVYLRNIDPAAIPLVTHAFDLAGGWLDLSDVRDFGDEPFDQWTNLRLTGSAGGVIGYGDAIVLRDGDVGFQIGGSGTGRGVYVVVDAGPGGVATLSGSSNYVGYTRVDSGVLSVSRDASLGNTDATLTAVRDVILNGGALLVTGSMDTQRQIELRKSGTVIVNPGVTTSWYDLSGTGNFTKSGEGTLFLTRPNGETSYFSGSKTVEAGTLQGRANVLGGRILNSGTVALYADNQDYPAGVFSGTIEGGSFSKTGNGGADLGAAAVLSNINTINIEAGTLTRTSGAMNLVAATAINVASDGELWAPKGGTFTTPIVRVASAGAIRVGRAAGATVPVETLTIAGNYHGGDAYGTAHLYLGLGDVVNGQVIDADIFHVSGTASGKTYVSFVQMTGSGTKNLADNKDSLPLNVVRVDGGGGDFVQSGRVTYGVKDYVMKYDPVTGESYWTISLASEIPALLAVDAAIMLANNAAYDSLSQRLDSMGLIDGYKGRHGFDLWANGIYRRDRFSDTIYSGATSDTYGFQAGLDYTDANLSYAMGIFVDYVGSNIKMPYDTDAESGANGFGAYITYRPKEWYYDLLIRLAEGRYRVNIPNAPQVRTDTGSAGISMTIGRHFAMKSGITLAPEVQAAWTRTNVDNVKSAISEDGTGRVPNYSNREYRFEAIQSTSARASLMASKLFMTSKGWEVRPYARAGVSYEFGGGTTMKVYTIGDEIHYNNDLGGPWGTLNAGASVRIRDRFDVWTDLAWNFAGKVDGYSINLGAGYRF